MMEHRGYLGAVAFDDQDNVLDGRALGIRAATAGPAWRPAALDRQLGFALAVDEQAGDFARVTTLFPASRANCVGRVEPRRSRYRNRCRGSTRRTGTALRPRRARRAGR